jgi:predicted enzyme related to lactoylglutathione lyase
MKCRHNSLASDLLAQVWLPISALFKERAALRSGERQELMVKEIAFTECPAKDVAALRRWYEEKLGLRFGAPHVQDETEKYAQAKVGDGYFSVSTFEWIGRAAGSASGVYFQVDDIAKTVADLRGKGVEVSEPVNTPVCRVAYLEDAEGNKVSLHQITVSH